MKYKLDIVLLNIRQEAIYQWIKRWHTMGIVGLMILSGRGLKAPLSDLLAESMTDSMDLLKIFKKKLPLTLKK